MESNVLEGAWKAEGRTLVALVVNTATGWHSQCC